MKSLLSFSCQKTYDYLIALFQADISQKKHAGHRSGKSVTRRKLVFETMESRELLSVAPLGMPMPEFQTPLLAPPTQDSPTQADADLVQKMADFHAGKTADASDRTELPPPREHGVIQPLHLTTTSNVCEGCENPARISLEILQARSKPH